MATWGGDYNERVEEDDMPFMSGLAQLLVNGSTANIGGAEERKKKGCPALWLPSPSSLRARYALSAGVARAWALGRVQLWRDLKRIG